MEEDSILSTYKDLRCKNCCHGNLASWRREFKEIFKLAWTTIIFTIAFGSFNVMNIIFCGHLGKKELAAASLGLSFCNVTGVSFAYGVGSALDTLFSQIYGSENKKHVGIVLQRSLLIMGLGCILIWALYVNVEYILIAFQIDRDVARGTAVYVHVIIIGVPGLLLFMVLQRYLQNQNIVISVMLITVIVAFISIPVHYFSLFFLHLKIVGAALAISSLWWILSFSFIIYIKIRNLHKQTWAGWSRECLQDWGVITKLGVAGVLMLATEWWVFEIAVFLMGAEGEIAVGAQGALLQIVFVLSMPSLGVWIAASIRVGNCLGANQPKQAKQAAVISLISIGIISTVCAVILLCLKDFVGKVFTQEVEVVNEISRAIPLLALLLLVDPLGVVSMGILQGCGLQKVAAIVNCVIYYVISLPLMCVLVLVFDLSVMGTWIALDIAVCIKAAILIICIMKIDWQKQANKAQKRAGVVSQGEQLTTTMLYNDRKMQTNETEMDTMVISPSVPHQAETCLNETEMDTMVISPSVPHQAETCLNETEMDTKNTLPDQACELPYHHTQPMYNVIIRRTLTFLIALLILGASILVHFVVELPSISETYKCVYLNGTKFLTDVSMHGTELIMDDNNNATYTCNITLT